VQVIPHVTDEIKKAISSMDGDDVDIVINEIGGTVGDIESLPFLEAIRQFRQQGGRESGVFMHITLVPYIKAAKELKTKPSQQSVGILRTIGIIPDILVCRCECELTREHKEKLALFCNVEENLVIEERDVANSIYEVPMDLTRQDVDVYLLEKLGLHVNKANMSDWQVMLQGLITPPNGEVEVAVVGKYTGLQDAYKSIYEALVHGGIANGVKVKIRTVESEDLEKNGVETALKGVCGVLVPGGFGDRGILGKTLAVKYAREMKIPFFGICLGMQCAVIEFARNVCGMAGANSTEFDASTEFPVIDLMPEQRQITRKGATMRLGSYPCRLEADSKARAAYGVEEIRERHRHRYEVNNDYREALGQKGLRFPGLSPDGQLVEMIEITDHPWFVASQFHPEFQSSPLKSHPLFREFICAARGHRDGGSR